MQFSKDYLINVANVAMSQIIAGVGISVVMSWGIRGRGCGEVEHDGNVMPCLLLNVSGLIHTGLVVVALNEDKDTYEVQLRPVGKPAGEWIMDVYCDQLGSLIDSLVEKPKDMSDEDYKTLANVDSFVKMVLEG